MLLALAVILLATAAYLVGEAATASARERQRSLNRAASYGRITLHGSSRDLLKFRERVIAPGIASFARLALKVNPRVSIEAVGLRLHAAGMGRSISPTSFLAAQAGVGCFGALSGFLLGLGTWGPMGALAGAATLGVGGFKLPGIMVSSRASRRRERIRAELPDSLDLLAVSVEAGLGFDGAVAKLTEHMEGALAEEFSLTLGGMRIGESRQDALKKLAERAATPEIGAFARAIIQADQLGISLGRILRVQAVDSRDKRQAAAEERAMKAPIKMLFPTVLFIFPAMFLVILGPAMLSISKIL